MKRSQSMSKVMERLEDRILFDAVPDGGFLLQPGSEPCDCPDVAHVQDVSQVEARQQELILVDEAVENFDQLVDEILANQGDRLFEIRFLNSSSDGIDQISQILMSADTQYDAIHVLSHGSDGNLSLGNTQLNSGNLDGYSDQINGWMNHLSEDADILLYGCNLTQTDTGQAFIQQLSVLSGADVAASDDTTGASDLGGDWELEDETGDIEAGTLYLTMWDGKLEAPTSFTGDGEMYQVYSKYGQLAQLDLDNGTFADAANNAGTKVNAVGYRTADNFAYGMIGGTHEVGRVGSNGVVQSLGTVTGLPTTNGNYFVGDFADDGLLYLHKKGVMYGVNVDTLTVDNTVVLSGNNSNIYDIAWNTDDDRFYTSQRGAENKLLTIELDGTVTEIGGNGIGKLTFGAMFSDATGAVYGSANQTGYVYMFDRVTGEATQVGLSAKSGTNDGFSDATKVLDIPVFAANDEFTIQSPDTINGNVHSDNGNGIDNDANGDTFAIYSVQGATENIANQLTLDSGALVTVNADGTFNYDTNNQFDDLVVGQTFTDRFSYTIQDEHGNFSTAEVVITIEGTYEKDSEKDAGFEVIDTTEDVTNLKEIHEEYKTTVVSAGDFNNDGFEDALVGDAGANDGTGAAYVVYGTASGHRNNFDVTTLLAENGGDGSEGVVIHGANAYDLAGISVDSVGDVNGDGIDDIVIGATDVDTNGENSGAAYVVFGGNNSMGAEFQLSDLTTAGGGDGSEGFVVNGVNSNDLFGGAVGGVGDLNNDGIADFAISATDADVDGRTNTGQTFVVFGNNTGFSAEMNASSLLAANGGDGSEGFAINGIGAHDLMGNRIVGGADVNGDGIDDMLVSSMYANANDMVDSGQSYVIYGNGSGFNSEVDLADLLERNGGDGSVGLVVNGSAKQTSNGAFVTFAEDTNDDGIAELAMGVGDPNSNNPYIVLGGSDEMSGPEIDLISLKDAGVYADNFDNADANYDLRSWDKFINNVTLHSTEGTRVTIWGDPHVDVEIDGVHTIYDIGYGAGAITLSTGTQISWSTYAHDPINFPLGPPLEYFNVDKSGTEFDLSFDTADGTNVVDQQTGLTEAELREFAEELAKYAGNAFDPLTYNG